jgi:hypothetical protein
MFNPTTEYLIVDEKFSIRDFHAYREDFVVRPPYQRKNVWSTGKQQALLDSLFRRYYVPRIVLREVRLSDTRTVYEVIDGQQRINTVQQFLANELPLPDSLADISRSLPGTTYAELSVEIRKFVDKKLVYTADVVRNIGDPENPDHQEVATEIFWRLQEGEPLNYMERAHSRLSSVARNFVVKYADDIRFDYDTYQPVDENPDKHPFFSVIERNNDRMQHLALLTRLLILEENGGPSDIRHTDVVEYVNRYEQPDGIGSYAMEQMPHAKQVLRNMWAFYDVFKDDPMLDEASGIKELRIEYYIISVYLLLRHLLTYYVFADKERDLFHDFVVDFHDRWRSRREDDNDVLIFSDNRQQSAGEIQVRDRIIRQIFFEYAAEKDHKMLTKDERRAFSEAERIRIYRRDEGHCQMCLAEGRPQKEAQVSWSEYEADHVIPHARGGRTDVENAQVLCRYHNRQKRANPQTEARMAHEIRPKQG